MIKARLAALAGALVLAGGLVASLAATPAFADTGFFDLQLYGHSGFNATSNGHNQGYLVENSTSTDFREITQSNGGFELQDSNGDCINIVNSAAFADSCVPNDNNENFIKSGYLFINTAGLGALTTNQVGSQTFLWAGHAASWSTPGS